MTAGIFPFPAFELLRKTTRSFRRSLRTANTADVRSLNVTIGGQADLAIGWNVSGDYFRGLAVAAAAGRLIMADDDRAGAPAVAVVSHGFGQRRFGDAANAVGQAILINGLPFTVVGVTPPEFFGVDPAAAPDIYLPMHVNRGSGRWPAVWLSTRGLPRAELLLDSDHGAIASRRHARAGPGRARAGVPALGRGHGRQ